MRHSIIGLMLTLALGFLVAPLCSNAQQPGSMRWRLLRHATGPALTGLATLAFIWLYSLCASADVQMVQRKHDSKQYGGKETQTSQSIMRTWAAAGKLRQDYGDPAGFTHIERLDRRPGELISYLITFGGADKTYWTYCRPFVPIANRTNPEERHEAGSPERLTVEDTGETRTINGFPARQYLLRGRLSLTEFTSEIWASTDVAAILERYGLVWGVRMERTDSELRIGEAFGIIPIEMRTIRGFPVLITEVEHNQYVHYSRTLELIALKEEPLPPNIFDLPAGLTKKFLGAAANPPVCED